MQHPWGKQPVRALGLECRRQPVTARLHDLRSEGSEAPPPKASVSGQGETRTGPRPQLGTQYAEDELCIRADLGHRRRPRSSVLGGVGAGVRREERAAPVRERRRGRMLRVQVLEPAGGELVSQLGMRRPADPERVPGTEHVVEVPVLRELGRSDRPAELRLALEQADVPPGAREQRAARERVDAAADDDGVVLSHAPYPGRRHLPTPPARDRRSTRRTSSDDRRDPPPCTASRRTGSRPAD